MHADPKDALVNATAAAGRVGRRPNYFWRHWRGELTLVTSYWVNDFLVSIVVTIAASVLTTIVGLKVIVAPRLVAVGLAAILLTTTLLAVWQIVGTWRCARRVRAERRGAGKRAVRTYVVQALMVYGVAQMSWLAVTRTLPSVTALLGLAVAGDNILPHTLRVVNAGTEILVGGGIDFGSTADLERLLDATPTVRTLDFMSPGGRLAEANAMATMIRARHLATYTNARCASACAIAFAAGQPRYLGPYGRLGFHQGSFPGISGARVADISQNVARFMERDGIDPAFAAKANAVPANKIWYPDRQELLRAHVATALVDGMGFALVATEGDPPNVVEVTQMLLRIPAFGAFARAQPLVFANSVMAYLHSVERGDSLTTITMNYHLPLFAVALRNSDTAADALQVELARLNADIARVLQDKPRPCMALVYGPGLTRMTYFVWVPLELRRRTDNVFGAIIDAAAGTVPAAPITAPELAADTQSVAANLQAQGIDMSAVAAMPVDEAQQRVACAAYAVVMDQVAGWPPERAGKMMRYLWHQRAGSSPPP